MKIGTILEFKYSKNIGIVKQVNLDDNIAYIEYLLVKDKEYYSRIHNYNTLDMHRVLSDDEVKQILLELL